MGARLVADEVLRAIPLESLIRWVRNTAEGLGYAASLVSDSDPYTIILFQKVGVSDGIHQLIEAGQLIASSYGTKDELRYRIFCEEDRQSAGFPPCHVGAEIMRYLLRLLGEPYRTATWQPLPADNAIAPSEVGAQKSESERIAPIQSARLTKWIKAWEVIKPEVLQNHLTGYEIARKIEQTPLLRDKLRYCPQSGYTLQKIIEAGIAGELDR